MEGETPFGVVVYALVPWIGVMAGGYAFGAINVVHLGILHLLAGLTALAMGFGTTVLTELFLFFPKGWGVGLGGVYVAWLVVLAALYPLSRWFAALKQRRTGAWLSYP